jgi:hypothetical protein
MGNTIGVHGVLEPGLGGVFPSMLREILVTLVGLALPILDAIGSE